MNVTTAERRPMATDVRDKLSLSVEECAALVGVSRTELYRRMKSGELPSYRVGKRRLIRRVAAEAWAADLEARETATGGRWRQSA